MMNWYKKAQFEDISKIIDDISLSYVKNKITDKSKDSINKYLSIKFGTRYWYKKHLEKSVREIKYFLYCSIQNIEPETDWKLGDYKPSITFQSPQTKNPGIDNDILRRFRTLLRTRGGGSQESLEIKKFKQGIQCAFKLDDGTILETGVMHFNDQVPDEREILEVGFTRPDTKEFLDRNEMYRLIEVGESESLYDYYNSEQQKEWDEV